MEKFLKNQHIQLYQEDELRAEIETQKEFFYLQKSEKNQE